MKENPTDATIKDNAVVFLTAWRQPVLVQTAVDAHCIGHALIACQPVRKHMKHTLKFLTLFCSVLVFILSTLWWHFGLVCSRFRCGRYQNSDRSDSVSSWVLARILQRKISHCCKVHIKSPYLPAPLCSGLCISWCLDTYRSLNKEACQRGASLNREIIQTVRHRLIKTSSPFTALVLH